MRWCVISAACAAAATVAPATADVFELQATLNGDQQVPPNDSIATGAATMTYDDQTNLFFLDVVVEGIAVGDITGTHIHAAPEGQNGPVVVNLLTFGSWEVDGDGIRLTVADGQFPDGNELDLLTGGTYINVHTTAFPGGEIRGQILAGGGGCDGPAFDGAINEVRIDHPGSDVDEYAELIGAPGADLTDVFYLVVGDAAPGGGFVENITDLTGFCVPDDGFLVIAEETFTLGTADVVLPAETLNFENSDNVTHLVVRGLNPAINTGDGFGGSNLDQDMDGFIDATGDWDGDGVDDGPPWSELIDSVALIEEVGAGDAVYSDNVVGPDGTFVPGQAYRCPDGDGGWLVGGFGTSDGTDTPGAPNVCDDGEVATLVSATVTSGTNFTGGVPELLTSDDAYYGLRSQFGFTVLERNLAEVEILATTTLTSPSSLDLSFEDRTNTVNTTAKVRVRNVDTNALVEVGTYAVSVNTDATNTILGLDGATFVNDQGEITLRLKYVAPAVFQITGFDARTDLLEIFVQ